MAERMLPLSNRVMGLSKLLDQVIANVDKHENQVDLIEQALFGNSRHSNDQNPTVLDNNFFKPNDASEVIVEESKMTTIELLNLK